MKRGFKVAKGYENQQIEMPIRKTKASAGYDIAAAEDITIPSFEKTHKPTLIATGLKAYMQDDEVLMLLPRSSNPKKGIAFPHSMGVIDADYFENETNDGHIYIQCINIKDEDITIKKGDLIAQGVFQKILFTDNDQVSDQIRTGGFGTTDK